MNKICAYLTIALLFLGAGNCSPQKRSEGDRPSTDRLPVVAGQFYPADPMALRAEIDRCFREAVPSGTGERVAALIVPHAGYVFSGSVAASAYRQLDPDQPYSTVFIIGPSHHVGFDGASIYAEGDFLTPLGRTRTDRKTIEALLRHSPLISSRTDAHDREHSIEVQLPFLQHLLGDRFMIVPISVGTSSPETCARIAGLLQPYMNSENLFIISSDFSHYPSYDDAVRADTQTGEAILSNSIARVVRVVREHEEAHIPRLSTSMCGSSCVLILLGMTRDRDDVEYRAIQYRNSGDVRYGDRSAVVGYHAIAVRLKSEHRDPGELLSENDKKALLGIARDAVENLVASSLRQEIDTLSLGETARMPYGAFVTLRKKGELRGCIGLFESREPLYTVVGKMAVAAASQDYRFMPVEESELGEIEYEISVLTPMRKISSIDEIDLGRHGIYVRKGSRSGTFLPQVATETGWTREEFLGHCSRDKAGLGWDGWKEAEIYIYEAIVFSDEKKK